MRVATKHQVLHFINLLFQTELRWLFDKTLYGVKIVNKITLKVRLPLITPRQRMGEWNYGSSYLHLDTGWGWVVGFSFRQLCLHGKTPGTQGIGYRVSHRGEWTVGRSDESLVLAGNWIVISLFSGHIIRIVLVCVLYRPSYRFL